MNDFKIETCVILNLKHMSDSNIETWMIQRLKHAWLFALCAMFKKVWLS